MSKHTVDKKSQATKKRCDAHLILCSNMGASSARVECFCHKFVGHLGDHKGAVTKEINGLPVDEENQCAIDIWWK